MTITLIKVLTEARNRLLAPFNVMGRANLIDCVREHSSPWFIGPYGFVMAEPEQVDFIPYLGMPGIFEYKGGPIRLSE